MPGHASILRNLIATALAAALLATGAAALAERHTAALRAVSPTSASPGSEVTLTGENILAPGGPYRSSVMYGPDPGPARGELPSSSWSTTQVRARLPADIAAGTYWLGIYRDGREASNRVNVRVTVPPVPAGPATITIRPDTLVVATGVSSARVVSDPVCAGESVVQLSGGPFQPGTDSRAIGPYRWRSGTTGVEVAVDDAAANRFWNQLIYEVHVASEREIRVRLGRCFVVQKNPRIQVIFPDGRRSNWVNIPGR